MTCCKQVGEITPHFPDQFVPQQGASGASRRSGSSTAWAVSLDPQLSSLRWTICPSASSVFHFWTIFPFTQPPVRNNTKTSILMFNVDDRIWTSFCWLRQQDAHLWSSSFPGGGDSGGDVFLVNNSSHVIFGIFSWDDCCWKCSVRFPESKWNSAALRFQNKV